LTQRSTGEVEGGAAAVMPTGSGEVELMQATCEDSPVGKIVAKRGPGVHHVAYAVADIELALKQAQDAGVELIDAAPRPGMHGGRIAFLHPKSVGGVLTELVEA